MLGTKEGPNKTNVPLFVDSNTSEPIGDIT